MVFFIYYTGAMWTCKWALAFVKTLYSVPFLLALYMYVSLFACFYYGDHCDAKVNKIALL